MKGKSRTVSPAEAARLRNLHKAEGAPSLEPEGESPTVALSTIEGAAYYLGDLPLQPATLEHIAALNAIDSPFVRATGIVTDADMSPNNIAKSVFVFAAGAKACRPIMALVQRRKALERYRETASSGDAFFARFLDKSDELAQVEAEFEADAIKVYALAGLVPIEETVSVIRQILTDAMDGFSLLPDEGGKKKEADSTSNT
jgi:hypothetical protein